MGVSISQSKRGCKGHKQSEQTKKLLRELALQRKLGGFNMRHKGILYKGVKLDSSYELELAKNLDENNVE